MALEGETLKGWKIGKKLGSGACSDVYAVDPVTPLSDKNCDAFVMKISPLVEIDATKAKNKKRKKSAAERNADALYAEHLMYQSHLRDHVGLAYIPQGAYGEDKGHRFLVMERLGRTLGAVVQENGPIPSMTAAQLGLSLLDTLQYIHSKNIVYVDIKPENFMLDRHKENRVFFVDFGIADRYIMATGKHKEPKIGTIVGTPTFLSLNCHTGAAASRRDDVEALLHVLIYLMRGDLPWQSAASDAEGALLKKKTSISELCKALPSQWAQMLTKARACGFDDKPDYEYYTTQLIQLGAKTGATTAPFVWGSSKSKASTAASASTASPARKKSKSQDKTPPPPVVTAAAAASKAKAVATKKTKNSAAAVSTGEDTQDDPPVKEIAKRKVSPRKGGATTRSSPSKKHTKTKAKKPSSANDSEEEEHEEEEEEADDASGDDDDVEFVKTAGKDPRRRRKAAAKAVAAAAAAEAAAKQAEGTGRYALRSRS